MFPRRRSASGREPGRRRTPLALVAAAALAAAATTVPPAAADSGAVPVQYVAKLYTEVLGRAPDRAGYAGYLAGFAASGCSPTSLREAGESFFTSGEFSAAGYDHAQQALVAYRAVLNREPDPGGLADAIAQLDAGRTIVNVIDGFYASGEFTDLAGRICGANDPDYGWGTLDAADLPVSGPGYSGDQAGLQAALDAAGSGGSVTLAENAVVRLTGTLRIPSGVHLYTTGQPKATRYAAMGRLVRQPGWSGESVRVEPGARLTSVWVTGDRTRETSYDAGRKNIRTAGGADTVVRDDRVDETAGATSLETLTAAYDGVAQCARLTVADNLITVYSSRHGGGLWSDGISNHCEDADISGNGVVDATDVGIVSFVLGTAVAQRSHVHGNLVVQAGHESYGMLGADPYFDDGPGDAPGNASRSFAGFLLEDNTLYTSDRVMTEFGIAVGTREWFGDRTKTASGGTWSGNTSDGGTVRAMVGIVVSGMLDVTVTGNDLNTDVRSDGRSSCTPAAVGASVSAGYASGTLPAHTDAFYNGCLVSEP
ncbi:DUF4214 domain-containing protein [Actinomadura parmotrematis]|uniref:DUF4214 domain-containing protein n=1 Tax=Actinomadura parmotrematis TaxID=2864039 RepID=A0ABS7G1Y6_9ACTN|nr:DUF4214 domain-containing protein [Actinomadura parmotrematis]MBW8486726.1 DUF4214 domain-containing protein [Actinomadura parmotrematis]